MNTHLLLLADSRLPAGGHAHSGGLEPAATAGAVEDIAGLTDFLRGRLATAGLVAAALSAASCAYALSDRHVDRRVAHHADDGASVARRSSRQSWARLDAETDARTPSPAGRRASRAQGRALLRVARTTWPHAALEALAATAQASVITQPIGGPHHPVVLGAATAAAGGTPEQAAAITAYGSVTGPAAAAVRLLGLDPLAVHRALAGLAPDVDAVAREAAGHATGGWAALPALSAPMLDLYAERHLHSEMRLFES